MDLKHFRKTSQAADHTVLSHPDGHQIKVLHAKLDKGELKKLKALPIAQADGGMTLEGPNTNAVPDSAKNMYSDEDNQTANEKEKYGQSLTTNVPQGTTKMHAGQRMRAFPDGGDVQPDYQNAAPAAQTQPQQQVMPQPDYSQALKSDLARQKSANINEALAQGELGNAQAGLYGAAANADRAQMKGPNSFDERAAALNTERQQVLEDYKNGHINPDAYFSEKSELHPENQGHSKVMTAIGLILGGLGSGLTRGPNVALDYLNKQIDRNVAAQTADMNRKQNVMTALTQQLGNISDAQNMHRVMQADLLKDRINQAAAVSKSPLAFEAAQGANAQIDAKYEPDFSQMKFNQGLLQGVNNGQVPVEMAIPRIVPPAQQKDAFAEAGKARDAIQSKQTILDAFDQAAKENTAARTGFGMLRTPASITALHNLAMPLMKDKEGRINELEMHTQFQNDPMPGDMDAKIAQKRQSLVNWIDSKSATPVLNGFGIRPPQAPRGAARPNPNGQARSNGRPRQ